VVFLCLAAPVSGAATADIGRLLKAVQDRYNRAGTLQVLFQQSYKLPGRISRTEWGELSLRKPGRMRWVYESPKGKLFVSDGKEMFLYSPASNRVQRMRVKETDDLRAPMGFLLGKLDFWRDFDRFLSTPDGGDVRIAAEPKSERAPYTNVEFVVTPSNQIRYLKIQGQDGSIMEFHLSGEKLNPPLAESLFRFTPPAGAEVVDGLSERDEEP